MEVEPVDDAAQGVEVPLAGGDVTEGVVRVGGTVRRPRGPWSSSVATYLHNLDQVGFREAPRYLGIDERGRDILQFIPGDVPSQPVVEPWAAVDLTRPGLRLGDIVNTAIWWVPRPGKTFNWTARRAS